MKTIAVAVPTLALAGIILATLALGVASDHAGKLASDRLEHTNRVRAARADYPNAPPVAVNAAASLR